MFSSLYAENFKRPTETNLPHTSKLRCSLLKRLADLAEEDGDGRKKIALTALGDTNVDLQGELDTEVESNAEEIQEGRALNSTTEKGKAKAKYLKRKTQESQPPCPGAGRVCTRSNTKKK